MFLCFSMFSGRKLHYSNESASIFGTMGAHLLMQLSFVARLTYDATRRRSIRHRQCYPWIVENIACWDSCFPISLCYRRQHFGRHSNRKRLCASADPGSKSANWYLPESGRFGHFKYFPRQYKNPTGKEVPEHQQAADRALRYRSGICPWARRRTCRPQALALSTRRTLPRHSLNWEVPRNVSECVNCAKDTWVSTVFWKENYRKYAHPRRLQCCPAPVTQRICVLWAKREVKKADGPSSGK